MEELFTRPGLDEKETHVFLVLVRLGACPVSRLAKHARLNRSSLYTILQRLELAGFITSFTHSGIRHVQAVPIGELTALLNDKEDALASTRTMLEKSLPELSALQKTNPITPKVQFYEGVHRVEMLYEMVLKESSFRSFFHPGRVKAIMPEYFHKIPEMLKKRNGRAKELLVACKEALEYQDAHSSDRHEIKIFNKSIAFSSDTIITKEKIFLVGYSHEDAVATEIWNRELADTQRAVFDMVWRTIDNDR
ncbi:MAG: helix-turn-helix domain-containing protein [Patescibacteria group bacterium]